MQRVLMAHTDLRTLGCESGRRATARTTSHERVRLEVMSLKVPRTSVVIVH